MTRTITDLTDFTEVEDTIADWVEECSQLPLIKGQSKTYWQGFDFERKRPYATLNIITQKTGGEPWTLKEDVTEGNVDKKQVTIYQPFVWSVDINFFTDSYTEDGDAIRETARRYAQRLQNRAFLDDNKRILQLINVSYAQLGQTGTGTSIQDEDKYIQQSGVEFRFNGIARTKITDTDFFETIADPTINLSEA